MKRFLLGRTSRGLVDFYDYIEQFLSILKTPVLVGWEQWIMRLPKFYINFDKKYIGILIGN